MIYFVSEDGGLQKLILNIKELKRTYNSVNIVKKFWAVVEDFGITANFKYFVGDSYLFNDIILKKLFKLLLVHEVTNIWDLVSYCFRCNGHVVNLAVIMS